VWRIRRSVTNGHVGVPKNHQQRSVDLDPATIDRLGRWWGKCGSPDDDYLVFAGANGVLSTKVVSNALARAMKAGGVPPLGPTRTKRTMHSLRHTHARICLERGMTIDALMRRLGHQSITVTIGRYGHWSAKARKAEASKIADAFIA
jgi:integrase